MSKTRRGRGVSGYIVDGDLTLACFTPLLFKEKRLTTSYSCLRNTLGSRALLLDLNLKYCVSLILSLFIFTFCDSCPENLSFPPRILTVNKFKNMTK